MDKFLVKVSQQPENDIGALQYRDVWELICRVCDWPELYALTKTCKKARRSAKKQLETQWFPEFCRYLDILLRHCIPHSSSRYAVFYEGIPGRFLSQYWPYKNYSTFFYTIYNLFKNWTLRDIKTYLEKFGGLKNCIESFQRFSRISRAVKLPGGLKEWKRIKAV